MKTSMHDEDMCHFTIAAVLVKILFVHRHMHKRYEQAPKLPKIVDIILDILSSNGLGDFPLASVFISFSIY